MTRVPHELEPIKVWAIPPKRDAGLTHAWGSAPPCKDELPASFIWRNSEHQILEIANRWTVHSRWWEPGKMVWRQYFKVVTDTGILCQVYHDLLQDRWFFARLYD